MPGAAIGLGTAIGNGAGRSLDSRWLGVLIGAGVAVVLGLLFVGVAAVMRRRKMDG